MAFRSRAWTIVVLGVVGFTLIGDVVGWSAGALLPVEPAGSRETVFVVATRSVLALLAGFVALIAYLRWKRRSLSDLGWWKPAPLRGWIAAAVFTALWVLLILGGALRGRAPVFEPSWFNLYLSLLTAFAAGVVEEAVFRGFVMDELDRGGVGRTLQVLAAGVLFGLAHLSWGSLGGGFDPATAAGPVVSTAIMGLVYGGIYLASDRSLMPVVASHFVVNLLVEPWLLLAGITGTLGGG